MELDSGYFGAEFEAAGWLDKRTQPLKIGTALGNSLDKGEAAVIQLALYENFQTVCIDEAILNLAASPGDLSPGYV